MPWKIVRYIRSGNFVYDFVPDQWEKDGITCWPEHQSPAKQCDELSECERNGVVKKTDVVRQNIASVACFRTIKVITTS